MNIREITNHLESINFISNIEKTDSSIKPKRGVESLFKFEMKFQNQLESFYIGFNENFPLVKPIFFIKSFNQYGFIPHVEPDGFVCFAHDEGLVLDFKNPKGIIEESINLAVSTLDNGISGSNKDDFYNEFDNYLKSNQYIEKSAYSLVDTHDSIKKIKAFKINNTIFLSESKTKLKQSNLSSIQNKKIDELEPYIYVHLDSPIKPIEFDKKWYRDETIKTITERLSKNNKAKLNTLMHTNKTSKILLHFIAPNLSECLIGLDIKKRGLSISSEQIEIDVSYINRLDSNYFNNRGGAYNDLKSKKVLLIGCGSVGGFVAHYLVKSGIVNLTLVDNDKFTPDNINRHILGLNSINKLKTECLKNFINKSVIRCNISTENNTIEKAIKIKNITLKDYDLIISATGNPTINLWLNDLLISKHKVPLIITWVEPYGIGGHSILINNTKKGCYRCLMDPITNHNEAAFYSPNQSFIKSISSCSSVFTPYGILDSQQSANTCVRLALKYLLGNEEDNPIISWKGDSKTFTDNHYKLSKRYELSSEDLFNARYSFKKNNCETCAKL
ncbi:ThiF family adenylyltransferase [Flammeovirga sp. EKP202]|uniref:ThiF family adenylyltransferase n=1 Tax=Flammeovirga sp. EKP202 TaxID=2770592 RepID=UPI00165F8B82|nr:ThiF family adenylyltransferase [Flammeovirga sp. EKP202]MBD0405296.1 ThiF family adenylyltransferase [Flammeovirga sp. EKP202]